MIIELSCVVLSLKTTSCQNCNYSVAQQQLPLQWDGRTDARSDYQGSHLVSGTYTQDTRNENDDDVYKSIISAIHCNLFYGHGRKEGQLEDNLSSLPRYIVVYRLVNCKR